MNRKGFSAMIIIIVIAVVVVVIAGFYYFGSNLAGGGGTDQITPDSVQTGQPALVKVVFSVWGGGGSIGGRYTDIAFHYRLVGQSDYQTAQPEAIALPANYSDMNRYEAFSFTIPPYPTGTAGNIEFYYEMKLDGVSNRVDGVKTIQIVSGNNALLNSSSSLNAPSAMETKFTGMIQDVKNEQPYDGLLSIKVNGKWIIIGGGEMPSNAQNGLVAGLDLNNIQSDVGKKVDVFAQIINPQYPNNLTILGNAKYYVKVVQ